MKFKTTVIIRKTFEHLKKHFDLFEENKYIVVGSIMIVVIRF